jgi:hypothetical protein
LLFHSYSQASNMQHTAKPSSCSILHSGSIPAADLEAFCATLNSLISARQAAKQKKQQNGDSDASKVFQRTPAFIHAVIQDAIAAVRSAGSAAAAAAGEETQQQGEVGRKPVTAPKGGTTDVGQHTGGIPRDTAWPVVKAVLQVSSGCCCLPGTLHVLFI